jgi:hypothetical protein
MAMESFLLAAGVVAILLTAVLIAGSPLRTFALLLAVHLVFTIQNLECYTLWAGIARIRPDDVLALWVLVLWMSAAIDGETRNMECRTTGMLVVAFFALICIAFLRGYLAGRNIEDLSIQFKTFGGIIFFFPAMWILKRRESVGVLWIVLLTAAVIAALVFMYKGVTGTGAGVYYREATGLRIGTRQPNAIAAVMLTLVAVMWKAPRKPPLIIVIPSIIAMTGAVILSQTRALWVGLMAALTAGWILNLFRKEAGIGLARKLITASLSAVLMLVLTLFTISHMGILSVEDVAERTAAESGNYLLDTSMMQRLIAWSSLLGQVNGSEVLVGEGFGSKITYLDLYFMKPRSMFFVDSSYMQTYLNMGLVGVFALLLLYVSVIVAAARLFLKTSDRRRSAIALGVFMALTAIMVTALTGSVLTNYRFTILWIGLAAVVVTEVRRERLGEPYAKEAPVSVSS